MHYYDLTTPQQNIWDLQEFYSNTGIANIGGTLLLNKRLDIALWQECINLLIAKNDAIRIRIKNKNNRPVQYIAPYQYYSMEFVDFSEKTNEEMHETIHNWIQTPFSLYNNNLFEFKILRMNNGDEGGFLKLHHLIGDAWTISLFCKQIIEIYEGLMVGKKINLNNHSYIDFIKQEKEFFSSQKYQNDHYFWKEKFIQKPTLCLIKHITHDSKANRESFLINQKDSNRINNFCHNHKLSPAVLFKAAVLIYLGRINNSDDITIGIPVLNRGVKQKNTMGMFINTLPMRIIIDQKSTFAHFCNCINKELFHIYKHQKYPIKNILRDIKYLHKDINQLYDVFVSYQNAKISKQNTENEYRTTWYFNGHNEVSLSIHIEDRDDTGNLLLHFDYRTSVLEKKEIQFIYQRFMHIINQCIENEKIILNNIDIVSPIEKQKLLYIFNDSKADYPYNKSIHTLFQEQVHKRPNQIAAFCNNNCMTYKELDEKSDYIAYLIQQRTTIPENVIGIIIDRSFEMLIGLLGILKSGCAYLPISPLTPDKRIEFMLHDSNVKVLLIHSQLISLDNIGFDGDIIALDQIKYQNVHPIAQNNPESLAYVLYTSGSTGKPKAVMVEHHSVVNRINWMQKKYPLNANDVLLQKTPFTFDVSVWELFWALMFGGTVCMLKPNGEKDPLEIINTVHTYQISKIHFVPSMLNAFLEYLKSDITLIQKLNSLKQVFSSGEALLHTHVKQFYKLFNNTNTTLHNLYGPTECTIDVLYYDCDKKHNSNIVPIGKPVDNTSAYILDNENRLLPIGVVGELCISGKQVARGYLNRPDLTKEKFITNPFQHNQRIYKTGDLAKWDDNGNVIYIGRNDFQVKIRGYRIELEEIESKMAEYPGVSSVAVVDIDTSNGKSLCGYYTGDLEISIQQWQHFLYNLLPEYMIPAHFIKITVMPLSANGKIDKRKLSIMIHPTQHYIAPFNNTQRLLAQSIKNIMNIKQVSLTDNLFELGMDSITVIKLLSALRRNGIKLTTKDIFETPTIKELSDKINNHYNNNHILYRFNNTKTDNTLICIPYGGGSFAVFQTLADELLKDNKMDILSVELSGYTKKKYVDIQTIAEDILKELKNMHYKNYAILGHCVGSALAIELVRRLEYENYNVKTLFLTGILPPSWIKYYGRTISPWNLFTDHAIVKFLEYVSGYKLDYDKQVIAQFRNDSKRFFNYMYDTKHTKTRIKADICCIFGENDPMTTNYHKKYKKWYDYFNKEIYLASIKKAKHYFINTHPTELSHIIKEQIKWY